MNTWKVVNQVLVSVAAVVIIVVGIVSVCRKPVVKEAPVTKEEKTIPIDVIDQWEKAKAAAVADATKQLREDYEKQIAEKDKEINELKNPVCLEFDYSVDPDSDN